MTPCSRCGTPTPTSYGVCSTCLSEHVRVTRAAQGLPHREERPEILDRVARAFTALPPVSARAPESERVA